MSGKCVIKASDMSPQMSKFATKVGTEALLEAQTETVSRFLEFPLVALGIQICTGFE